MFTKKLLAIIPIILLALFITARPAAADTLDSGICGTSVNWSYSSDGILTLTGSGSIDEFTAENPFPWNEYSSYITSVVIDPYISYIPSDAFSGSSATVYGSEGSYAQTYASDYGFTFVARDIPISSAQITLPSSYHTYNANYRKPSPTVTYNGTVLTEDTDYTVSYSNNKYPGTATVTITGTGYFSGEAYASFTIRLGAPTVKKLVETNKKIKVTWSKNSYADGYVIFRKLKGESTWTRVKVITSGSTTSWKDSSSKTYGKKYQYCVKAYATLNSNKSYSSYGTKLSVKYAPAAVTISDLMPLSKNSMNITWNKVSSADGYIIYRSTSGGSYKRIKVIAATYTLSYTDTSLTYGTTYTYMVRAYWKNGTKKQGGLSNDGTKEKLSYSSKVSGGYTLYYDANGDLITDVSGIIGSCSSYLIKVNKQMNTVTVYATDSDGDYTIPVKAFVCSTGSATPLGTYYTPSKYRWKILDHDVWGQWCTRITTGILFHSVWYYEQNAKTLSVTQYNKLGSTASAGCVRLCCRDAKWIYDNCSLGTKVIIYNSSSSGPLGKPTALTIPSWHSWDPTDPTMKSLCGKYGCHC
ncbi:MAG: L,D-transpeptidase family protein [Eubacterium sp.]|nr:L,D-transpeptidase family protein [Eubacterium sp.]